MLVDQPLAASLPTPGSLLVLGPAALLHPQVRQPDGEAVSDLITGHPGRVSRELVFLVGLVVELREWQDLDWATLAVDVEGVAEALVQLAPPRPGPGLLVSWPLAGDVKALGRPGMHDARELLRQRVAGWLAQQDLRWLRPTSGRRPGEPFR